MSINHYKITLNIAKIFLYVINLRVRFFKKLTGEIMFQLKLPLTKEDYNKKLTLYLKVIFFVLIFSEIYFYPFDKGFRFSFGIIILNIVLLLFLELSHFKVSIFSGIIIVTLRIFIDYLYIDFSLYNSISNQLPSILYYFIYGVLHSQYKQKSNYFSLVSIIGGFSLIDGLSNTVEACFRGTLNLNILKIIIIVAIIRSSVAYLFYIIFKTKELYIINLEHQKRYEELNLLVSNVQSELFYLNKSKEDLESIMKKSYKLYNELTIESNLKGEALSIAKDVHEVKKDYLRVIAGFNQFIDSHDIQDNSMDLKEAVKIIENNTKKLLLKQNLKIDLKFNITDNFIIKNHYSLFTIINNLVINSIEASTGPNTIQVKEFTEDRHIVFKIEDKGPGISQDIIPFLYNPGFTTKFDLDSGNPSNGIGLSHVKNIIENLNGTIDLTTTENISTVFTIKIPKNNLIG